MNKIRHTACVQKIDHARSELYLKVTATDTGECEGCAAAFMCRSSRGEELRVKVPDSQSYKVGNMVNIDAPVRLHIRAVWTLLLLPCLIMLVTMGILMEVGAPVWLSVLGSLSLTAGYYWVRRMVGKDNINEMAFKIVDSHNS